MIEDIFALRQLYPPPAGRAVLKQLPKLDAHCKRFIALAPFVVLASASREGKLDCSPRGGEPGFVKARGDTGLLIPDASGNNRLDTLTNIVETGRLGLLFLLPGVDETLRINGRALLSDDAGALGHFTGERRAPKLVIELEVEEAYLHCAKALMRSKLWAPETRVPRSALPTAGEMLRDQTGAAAPAESQEAMLARYGAIIAAEQVPGA
jgi:hypothetical protein